MSRQCSPQTLTLKAGFVFRIEKIIWFTTSGLAGPMKWGLSLSSLIRLACCRAVRLRYDTILKQISYTRTD